MSDIGLVKMIEDDVRRPDIPSEPDLAEHYTHMFVSETAPAAAALMYNRFRHTMRSVWHKIERRRFDDEKSVNWMANLDFPMKRNTFEHIKVDTLRMIQARLQVMEKAYNALFFREPVLGDLVLYERAGIAGVGKVWGRSGNQGADDPESYRLDRIVVDDCPGLYNHGRLPRKPENILCVLEPDHSIVLEDKDPVAVYEGRYLRCAGFASHPSDSSLFVCELPNLDMNLGRFTGSDLSEGFRAVPLRAKRKYKEAVRKDGPYR